MEYRWAVEAASGRFLYGGGASGTGTTQYDVVPGLSSTQIRVVLTRPPDPRTERYSGDPLNPFRPATTEEIATAFAEQKDAEALQSLEGAKAIKAAVICSLWGRLNRQPTGAEIAAERARFMTIYKAL